MAIEISVRMMIGNREVGPNGEMPSRDGLALTLLGIAEPRCPTCASQFPKMPQRKTKCPGCGHYVYSRTRPIDDQKVLLREQDLDQLNEEWSHVYGTHKEFLAARARRIATREKLRIALGSEPSEDTLDLRLLDEDASSHATDRNWGLYRNARFAMGEILRKQGDLEGALRHYFEVCYIDLSGPQNNGGMRNYPGPMSDYPDFRLRSAMLAPGVVSRCYNAAIKLGMGEAGLQKRFLDVANAVDREVNLLVRGPAAWTKLRAQLDLA